MNDESLTNICFETPSRPGNEKIVGQNPGGRSWSRPARINSTLEDPLYADSDAARPIQHETIAHRRVQELALQGYNHNEIALQTSFSPNYISEILRQPWARERMTERAKATANEEIKAFLEQEALPSLQLLAAVRDDCKAKYADRVKAADSLADRFLGKAAQPITSASAVEPKKLTTEELIALADTNGLLDSGRTQEPVVDTKKL